MPEAHFFVSLSLSFLSLKMRRKITAIRVLPAPRALVHIRGNPDVKALCELLPSGVIIIIISCKTRGLDQLISMGFSPALMPRISRFPSWEFMQTEGAGRSWGL